MEKEISLMLIVMGILGISTAITSHLQNRHKEGYYDIPEGCLLDKIVKKFKGADKEGDSK